MQTIFYYRKRINSNLKRSKTSRETKNVALDFGGNHLMNNLNIKLKVID
jgi:hypothetical protein